MLASPASENILPAYQHRRNDSLGASLLIAAVIVYACVSGYFLGVFQQFILQQFLGPCAILALVILWALPDKSGVSHHFLERGFLVLMVSNILWPTYLAIALPGLPWITWSKLVLLATLLSFGVVLATDRQARFLLRDVFNAGRPAKIALITFIFIQFATMFLASNVGEVFASLTSMQLFWTAPLLVAALVSVQPDYVNKLGKCLVASAAVLAIIGLWEFHSERLPWVGHIPSFLKVNDPLVAALLEGSRRSTDGLYRVQTTFTTSLSLAEYLSLTMPFIIHYFLTTQKLWLRLALVAVYLGVIVITYATRARLGMIGIGIAHLAYPMMIALRRRVTIRNDLIGPAMIALYPAMLAGFMGLILASRRLYIMFIGGGQHQASNEARQTMFENALPLILKQPWGYGPNQGAVALGFRLPNGMLTIDSYYLTIVLDYGVIGFIAFYGMILYAMYLCIRVYLTSNDREARIAAPIAIALGSYFIIKSVLSQPQNQGLLFVLVGMALALNYRFVKRQQLRPRPALTIQ